jgi:hypothetical protein
MRRLVPAALLPLFALVPAAPAITLAPGQTLTPDAVTTLPNIAAAQSRFGPLSYPNVSSPGTFDYQVFQDPATLATTYT